MVIRFMATVLEIVISNHLPRVSMELLVIQLKVKYIRNSTPILAFLVVLNDRACAYTDEGIIV